MLIFDEERTSESPLVERIWRSHTEGAGTFLSIAECRSELVVTRINGMSLLTVRGPETRVTPTAYPDGGEWLGIRLRPGTFLRHLLGGALVDTTVTLPLATTRTFWLDGATWQFPDYDNADTFVAWLVRAGLLVRDPLVGAALQGDLNDLSARSLQRRFLRTVGITRNAVRQIERARYATLLLRQGVSILDTMMAAGYFDQPHLTRSLKRYIGQTPAQLMRHSYAEQLSFLYKTSPFE